MEVKKVESLSQLFHLMVELEASDMHLQVGSPPVMRIRGEPEYVQNHDVIVPPLMKKIIYEKLTEVQRRHLEKTGDLDLSLGVPGLARFRLNVFHQRGSLGLVARMVPVQIKSVKELNLPPGVQEFSRLKDGLVIISGATGSGKSTTLAAVIDQINSTRKTHIITIEDPIEYLYRNKKSIINQREVGIDVADFHGALRAAVRQDPDIILIGEMRDAETVEFGLTAAETGHLVFATVHASNVPQTIVRMLDLFPPDKHLQLRTSLFFNLRGIMCQKLVPAVDHDIFRVPAVELMFNNASAKKLIKDQQEEKLFTVISSCEKDGMQTFNTSLLKHANAGMITHENALKFSPNPEELKMNLQGIFLSKSGLVG